MVDAHELLVVVNGTVNNRSSFMRRSPHCSPDVGTVATVDMALAILVEDTRVNGHMNRSAVGDRCSSYAATVGAMSAQATAEGTLAGANAPERHAGYLGSR